MEMVRAVRLLWQRDQSEDPPVQTVEWSATCPCGQDSAALWCQRAYLHHVVREIRCGCEPSVWETGPPTDW